jgi:tetratricopeptide (TPR) repeat protein
MKDPPPLAARRSATGDDAEGVRDTLEKARALYRQGQVVQAQAIMEEVLKSQPRHHEALHLSGLIAYRAENPRSAAELIGKAIELNPGLPAPHNNLGNALRALNQPMAAIESFDRALALNPNLAEAHFNRANALLDLNRFEAAVESYDRAIALKPTHAEAHNNRGNALAALGKQQAAIASYDRAVDLKPDYAMALNNRGVAHIALKRPDAALEDFDRAIALQPLFAMAHNNRGNALTRLSRLRAAAESYSRAIGLAPKLAEPYTNLGSALVSLGQPRAALQQIDRALDLRPDYAMALSHRGDALRALLQLEAAIESYGRAMALKPDDALFRLNQAIAKLQSGDFAGGWPLYEWRTQTEEAGSPRTYAEPVWTGVEDISGKTLFVRYEQGLGDTIQFSRYVKLAEARGAKVVFSVQDRLVRLMSTLSPTVTVVDSRTQPRKFDYHIALLSMPLAFGTTEQSIPAEAVYLRAELARVDAWARRIGDQGFKIGIAWQGNPRSKADRGRSATLECFKAFADMQGVRLISLQVADGVEQLGQLPDGLRVETLGDGLDEGSDGFIDTAAVIANLDLVITVDTSIAHLAAALGKPTWVALKYSPDWRWLLGRSDSPWYPTVRLFRQESIGDWSKVFADMAAALAERLAVSLPSTIPHVPISWGELLDKITILEIKSERLTAESSLANVRHELSLLTAVAQSLLGGDEELLRLKDQLKSVNETLWRIEADIRAKEEREQFDQGFIELARSVYRHNDERAAIKRQINLRTGSTLVEEKSYSAG